MNKEQLKAWWEYVQDLIALNGDTWMAAFTAAIITRVLLAGFGHAALTVSEAAVYSSAIGAFAYSNKGPKQS